MWQGSTPVDLRSFFYCMGFPMVIYLRVVANSLAALFAIFAAALWLKSATARVPLPRPAGLVEGPDMDVGGYSFVGTAAVRDKWNRRAATAAAIAAACQGLGLIL